MGRFQPVSIDRSLATILILGSITLLLTVFGGERSRQQSLVERTMFDSIQFSTHPRLSTFAFEVFLLFCGNDAFPTKEHLSVSYSHDKVTHVSSIVRVQ